MNRRPPNALKRFVFLYLAGFLGLLLLSLTVHLFLGLFS